MTREEAIQILKSMSDISTQGEAIDMAIEALSAEEAVWNEYEAEFTDLPDIPRYYYEKVVGKMAHEINVLKEQLESAVPNCQKCAIKELWEETEKEDLVSVVRCKDCRHYESITDGYGMCRKRQTVLTTQREDDFCSYGERREPTE